MLRNPLRTLSAPLLLLSLAAPGCELESEGDMYGYPGSDASGLPPSWDGNTDAPDDETPGNRYDAPGTNPFVVAAYDPVSTFAADVDTASYDILRRDIGLGWLPDPDSVRLEDYVNAFRYDYPVPEADSAAPFSITLEAAPNPYADTLLLSVGIQGMEVAEERRPANLVFLVDVSGSMSSADKLPLVQHLLTQALDVLEPTDTIAVVTYAGDTMVRLEPTPVSQRATIAAVIEGLESAGSTNGAGGIQLAYAQAERGFIEEGINHVVLCTDGDFNVGVSSTEDLVSLIEEKRRTGITLTALGFGYGNLNDGMMEAVSNAGNGIYAVIANADHATQYAHDQLRRTFIHIAQDVKIQVEVNPERVLAYRLLGYENRVLADDEFRDDRVDAGEVGSGHRVTALYELVLVGSEVPEAAEAPAVMGGEASDVELTVQPEDLCRVRVRFKEPGASVADEADEVEEALTALAVHANLGVASDNLQWAAAVAVFAEILKESPYARPEALDDIEAVIDALAGTRGDRLEFRSLFDAARELLEDSRRLD